MADAERRTRVVMLVDTTIDGDSRVQKAAVSMAEAGWDVHLIGRTDARKGDRYDLGGATVYRRTLKPMPPRRNLRQSLALLRFPLAYPNNVLAERHWERRRIDRSEVAQRRFAAQRGVPGGRVAPRPLHRFAVRLRSKWLRIRLDQTRAYVDWQAPKDDGAIERFETAFWCRLLGDRAWRRLEPLPLQYELSYASLIDRLKPDLIHAHDYRMIGVAARAVARAAGKGRTVRLLYDAHEFLPGVQAPNPRCQAARPRYEREYLPFADAVVTVSPRIAELLESTHGLDERPAVVLNAPPRPDPGLPAPESGDVRAACGLAPGTPLAVYCGGASPARSLETIVDALEFAPDLHAAFVVHTVTGPYVDGLRERAAAIGAADRVHFMGYVDFRVLPQFLSTADAGVHPLRSGPVNHELALPTKLFEFMHGGLPVAVTDVEVMSALVRNLGVGEVFRSEDPRDLARALKAIVADRARYTKPYAEPGFLDEFTWETQARRYDELYRRLLGLPESAPHVPGPRAGRTGQEQLQEQ
jgi:glycosyltransferase involved in cell wall biosynthesis